ncbi:MAG TPA: hypothetical protein V6C90_27530 [Coleofasciculaceae cyanobacterium]
MDEVNSLPYCDRIPIRRMKASRISRLWPSSVPKLRAIAKPGIGPKVIGN